MKGVMLTRTISGVLAVALVIVGSLYAVDTGKLNTANQKVASLESNLATTNTKVTGLTGDLVTANTKVVTLTGDLATANTKVTSLTGDLSTANIKVTGLTGDLATANTRVVNLTGDLATANTKVTGLTNNLAASNAQVSYLTANLTEAISQIGTLKTQLTTGRVVSDPTYAAMLAFIASDPTDKTQYIDPTYICWDFAADVINRATSQSIRCAMVIISYNGPTGHAIVGFNTTDKGMVYIEPQADVLVNLSVGGRFYLQKIPPPGYYYPQPNYDDTVVMFKLVW